MYQFTKDELIYILKDLEAEQERLVKEYLEQEEDLEIGCTEYVEQHASDKFKSWLEQALKYEEELYKQKIIYG